MHFDRPLHKRRWVRNPWDVEDSPLMLDAYRALFGEVSYIEEYCHMGIFSDVLGGAKPAAIGRAVDDPDFEKQFPTLHMLMAHTSDDEGKARITCTLTVVCEDGMVKCGINERNHHLSLWTASTTLGGAFAALEEALAERPVKWRKVTWRGRGGKS